LDVTKSYKRNMILYRLIPILFVNLMHKKKSPTVEQVFLIYEDGRLISYASFKEAECLDEDLVGGMLTAVKSLFFEVFVKKEEGQEDIDLYKFEFGERMMILETGKHFFIAIVLLGRENKSLLSKSRAIVHDIEEKYGSVLSEWDGFGDDFKGVDEIILTLLPLDKLSETERKAIVEGEKRKKIFELWSKMWHSLSQDGLIPKPHTWKNLKWKPIIIDEKEPDEA
jgi:hypothetical protein